MEKVFINKFHFLIFLFLNNLIQLINENFLKICFIKYNNFLFLFIYKFFYELFYK